MSGSFHFRGKWTACARKLTHMTFCYLFLTLETVKGKGWFETLENATSGEREFTVFWIRVVSMIVCSVWTRGTVNKVMGWSLCCSEYWTYKEFACLIPAIGSWSFFISFTLAALNCVIRSLFIIKNTTPGKLNVCWNIYFSFLDYISVFSLTWFFLVISRTTRNLTTSKDVVL